MPNQPKWQKIKRDFCAPDRPDFLSAWRTYGVVLKGKTWTEIRDTLSPYPFTDAERCPAGVAKHLRWAADNVGSTPPTDWPHAYAQPGTGADKAQIDRKRDLASTKVEKKFTDDNHMSVDVRAQHLVMNLDQLADVANLDLDTWRVKDGKVNTWTTAMKVKRDGVETPEVVRNWQVTANLVRRLDGPDGGFRPVIGTPNLRVERSTPQAVKTAVIIPDSQNGYIRDFDNDTFIPIHDRRAWDIAVQVVAKVNPDYVVFLGDMLDLAEWSTRFPREAALENTTQTALDELHWWLAAVRAAAPHAKIVYIEGNHESRVQRALVETMNHAAGLRAVNDTEPAMSISRLLDLKSLDVEYVGPYGEDYYLWGDGPNVGHGTKARSGVGSTITGILKESHHSGYTGHIHSVEYASKQIHTHRGPKIITAASIGCICRVDGVVPGVSTKTNWTQAVGVSHWDGEQDFLEVVPINNGKSVFRGEMLVGEERVEEIAAALRKPALICG
ncbi:MAG: hypothetical protein P1V36_00045 [Planctomycetota bacterium]|nr:hypothetical protein [Planctomycetota bacterium]